MEEDKEYGVQFESGPVHVQQEANDEEEHNRGNSVWKCSRGQEEEREREFVVKCEQSGAKEDIAKYQLSSNSYNTAVELLTIQAIPTILQDIAEYQSSPNTYNNTAAIVLRKYLQYLPYLRYFKSIQYLRNSSWETDIQNVRRLVLQKSFLD